MVNNIFVSTNAFKDKDLEKILKICLENNIHNLELSSNIDYSEEILSSVRKYNRNPMNFLLHNYFPPYKDSFVLNLASGDNKVMKQSLEHCRLAIDLSAELGARFYSVHAGFAFDVMPEQLGKTISNPEIIPYKKAYDIFLTSTIALNNYAQKKGVKFLVENHEISRANLVNGKNLLLLLAAKEEFIEFYKSVNSDNLGFLIDLGHLKITGKTLNFDIKEFMDEIGPKVECFHLSDNDGNRDTHSKFERDVWFEEIIARFDCEFVLESQNLDVQEIIRCSSYLSDLRRKNEKRQVVF